nr:hypothetical protein HK105_004639 [Polyrhizophydium stewartii]
MATGRRAFGHAFAAPVVAEIQPAFQPGSTPERGNKRYLTFNLVGQVSSISGGDATATINVDYHDKSMRPFHFADHYLYTMAALNESGAAFASAACSTTPSTVFFRPSDSWATKGQWTIQLGADESATAVALTRTAIVVATDMHYLRLFSYGGVQTQLRSVPGPVLSMAGQGNMLFVVYHDGGVFHGNQSLSYLLLDSDKRATVLQGRLPTSPSSTLDWVGFSDTNIPLTYDSRGILRGLFAHDDAAWVPLLDARIVRGDKQDHYWAVGLADDKFMCVVCKSGDKMPAVGKVLVNEVPLQAPFAQLDVPSAQMEEQWFLKSLMMGHTMARDPVMRAVLASAGSAQIFDGDDDALEPEALNTPDDPYYRNKTALDKIVLQLVHAACQAERVQRALDLCSVLYSNKSLEGAIKLAVHLHLPALAERINALKEARYVLEKQRKQRADRRRIEARYGRSAFDRADDGDYERGDESVTTAGTHAARMNGRPREAADRGVVSGHSFAAAAAERRELLGKLKVAGAGGSVPAARSRPAEPSDTESLVSRSDLLADSDPAPPIQTHTEPAAPPARKLGNPFAIGADAAKPAVGREAAAVSASRQGLFDSLARATAQKDQEARDKKAALETVPAKRKQTTLFGMQPKAPDAVAAEKKPKKARGSGTPGQDEGAAEESDARPSIGTSSKVPSPLTLDKFASQTSKQRDDVASVLDKDTAADAAVIDKENADAGNTEPQDEEKMRRAAEKGKAPANPSTSLRSFAFVR